MVSLLLLCMIIYMGVLNECGGLRPALRSKKSNASITSELALIRRTKIDANLTQMAKDPEYQAEVLQMEAEFAVAQWEAFQTLDVSK